MGLSVGLVNIPLSPKMNHFIRADWNLQLCWRLGALEGYRVALSLN